MIKLARSINRLALGSIALCAMLLTPLLSAAQEGFDELELIPQTFEVVNADGQPAALTVGVPADWQAQYNADAGTLLMSNADVDDLSELDTAGIPQLAPGEAMIFLLGPLPLGFMGEADDAASLLNSLEGDLTFGEAIVHEASDARDVATRPVVDPEMGEYSGFAAAEVTPDSVYFGSVIANSPDAEGLTDLALRVLGSVELGEANASETADAPGEDGEPSDAFADLAPNGFEISGDPETAVTTTDASWQTAPTAPVFGSANQIGKFTIDLQDTRSEEASNTLARRYIPTDIGPGSYDVRVDPSTVQAGFTINREGSMTGGSVVGTLTITAVQDGLISGTLEGTESDMFAEDGEIMQDVRATFTDVAIPPVAACAPNGTPQDAPRPINIMQTVTPNAFMPDTTLSPDEIFWAVEAVPAQPGSFETGADVNRLNLHFSTLAFDNFNFNLANAYGLNLTGLPYELPAEGEPLAVEGQVSQVFEGAISTKSASGTLTFTQIGDTLAGEFTLTDSQEELTVTGSFSDLPYPELDCRVNQANPSDASGTDTTADADTSTPPVNDDGPGVMITFGGPVEVDWGSSSQAVAGVGDRSCRGFIPEAPTVQYTIPPGVAEFSVAAEPSEARHDPTLVARGPNGELYCDDETDLEIPGVETEGIDGSAMTITNPAPGTYRFWAGSYDAVEQPFPGRIVIFPQDIAAPEGVSPSPSSNNPSSGTDDAAQGGATVIWQATFDTDAAGWTTFVREGPANIPLMHRIEGGDGMICAEDVPFARWFFQSPFEAFADIDRTQIGAIDIDIRQNSAPENAGTVTAELNLGNGPLTLQYDTGFRLPFNQFTTVTIPVLPDAVWQDTMTGEVLDPSAVRDSLPGVTGLLINGAYGRGQEVCLSAVRLLSVDT